jgi:hypothetical protein
MSMSDPVDASQKYILEKWPLWSSLELQERAAASGNRLEQSPYRLRVARRILGLKIGNEFRYPRFQFDAKTGLPRPEMAELLGLLPKERTGWHAAFWFAQPNRRLARPTAPIDFDANDILEQLAAPSGARPPADVFVEDPARVVAFAQKEFCR